jgi:indolepyruvate ferredoxin oxidoreductase
MAAHIDELEVLCVDQIGLAQRGGAVDAHIRLMKPGATIPGGRIPLGEADVLIAADMVTAHGKSTLPLMDAAHTTGFLNSRLTPTAEFTLNTNTVFDPFAMTRKVKAAVKSLTSFDAAGLSRQYLGDAVYALMIMWGAAWQAGTLPLSRAAIEAAIKLNGAEVAANLRAFDIGRAYIAGRLGANAPEPEKAEEQPFDLEAFVAGRAADLTDYQNAAYAASYRALVEAARAAEAGLGSTRFTEAVARNAYKLMAYKDEYEVARLYCDPAFKRSLAEQFENADKISVFLAPPLFAEKDAHTGLPKKRKVGPWVFQAFAVLKAMKGLRGTAFDPFGHTAERKAERRLVADYRRLVQHIGGQLGAHNLDQAVALARLPEEIRGFGHIKMNNLEKAESKRAELLKAFETAQPTSAEWTLVTKTNRESVNV